MCARNDECTRMQRLHSLDMKRWRTNRNEYAEYDQFAPIQKTEWLLEIM